MKLYYAPGACSMADHIALIASGLPFDTERVDLKAKRTESGADYAQINPKGYVPALALDGGEVLTENIAILSYIAQQSGTLMAADGLAHWRVLEATAFISTEIHKGFKPFFTPTSTDADKAKAGEVLRTRFALLEPQVAKGPFLFGDTLTIADCYLFVMLFWATGKAGLSLTPAFSAYLERLRQHPAIRQALADEGLPAS